MERANTEKILIKEVEEEKEKIDKLNDRINKQKKSDVISFVSISLVLIGLIGALASITTSLLFSTEFKGANIDFSTFASSNKSLIDLSSSLNQTQNEVNSLKSYYQYLVDNLKTSTSSAELKSLDAR